MEDDVPECTTIKEFKCEQKTRGYTTEEVRELAKQNIIVGCWSSEGCFLEYEETAGGVRFTQPLTIYISSYVYVAGLHGVAREQVLGPQGGRLQVHP